MEEEEGHQWNFRNGREREAGWKVGRRKVFWGRRSSCVELEGGWNEMDRVCSPFPEWRKKVFSPSLEVREGPRAKLASLDDYDNEV